MCWRWLAGFDFKGAGGVFWRALLPMGTCGVISSARELKIDFRQYPWFCGLRMVDGSRLIGQQRWRCEAVWSAPRIR